MNEKYVEERVGLYTEKKLLYEAFAKKVLDIIKEIVDQGYPDIKIASYSGRAKEIESLRKKLRKDKYNADSEITDLAGVRIIAYSRKDILLIADIVQKSFNVDRQNSVNKTLALGNDRMGYRGDHYVV